MTESPWKTLSTTTVYENPWIRVEDHRVINPSGNAGQYGKICFKNRAVAILALDADERTYLVGQYRYPLDEYSWELPMGGAPLGQDPLAEAQRELREETGLHAAQWQEFMRIHPSNSVTDEIGLVYLARELTQGAHEPEETERLAVRSVPFAEAVEWTLSGRITDAISIAAILKLAAQAR